MAPLVSVEAATWAGLKFRFVFSCKLLPGWSQPLQVLPLLGLGGFQTTVATFPTSPPALPVAVTVQAATPLYSLSPLYLLITCNLQLERRRVSNYGAFGGCEKIEPARNAPLFATAAPCAFLKASATALGVG